MDTSVNAANQVVSVGADIAFDADPKFFACLVRFESSSVPTKTQSEPDRKSGSAGMPRPISYAVFCLKKKKRRSATAGPARACKLPCVNGKICSDDILGEEITL